MFKKKEVYVHSHTRQLPSDDYLLLSSIHQLQQYKLKPKLKHISNLYYSLKYQQQLLTTGKQPLPLRDNFKVAYQLRELEKMGLVERKGSKYYLTEQGKLLLGGTSDENKESSLLP